MWPFDLPLSSPITKQPFSYWRNFAQKRIWEKWRNFGGFQSPKVRENIIKISIYDFQCVAKNIEGWFIYGLYPDLTKSSKRSTFFTTSYQWLPLWLKRKIPPKKNCLQGTWTGLLASTWPNHCSKSTCIPLYKIHIHPSCKSTFMLIMQIQIPIVQIMKIITLCNMLLGRGHFSLMPVWNLLVASHQARPNSSHAPYQAQWPVRCRFHNTNCPCFLQCRMVTFQGEVTF
jgi:hypothetical protein